METTPVRLITQNDNYDDIWTHRKNKASGTITPRNSSQESVTISYDFTNCQDKILCAISGHTHKNIVDYCEGQTGLLSVSLDYFANRTIHFGLIDRANEQLNIWQLTYTNDTAAIDNWQAPFDKPETEEQ